MGCREDGAGDVPPARFRAWPGRNPGSEPTTRLPALGVGRLASPFHGVGLPPTPYRRSPVALANHGLRNGPRRGAAPGLGARLRGDLGLPPDEGHVSPPTATTPGSRLRHGFAGASRTEPGHVRNLGTKRELVKRAEHDCAYDGDTQLTAMQAVHSWSGEVGRRLSGG